MPVTSAHVSELAKYWANSSCSAGWPNCVTLLDLMKDEGLEPHLSHYAKVEQMRKARS